MTDSVYTEGWLIRSRERGMHFPPFKVVATFSGSFLAHWRIFSLSHCDQQHCTLVTRRGAVFDCWRGHLVIWLSPGYSAISKLFPIWMCSAPSCSVFSQNGFDGISYFVSVIRGSDHTCSTSFERKTSDVWGSRLIYCDVFRWAHLCFTCKSLLFSWFVSTNIKRIRTAEQSTRAQSAFKTNGSFPFESLQSSFLFHQQ